MSIDITDPTLGVSEPDRRWSTTNTGEAVTDILSPLCCSFWLYWSELGVRDAWHDLGVLPRGEITVSGDQNQLVVGCFRGRLAVNVDLMRSILGRIPGSLADDFERDVLGMVRPDAPTVPTSWRAATAMALKAPAAFARHSSAVRRLHRRQLHWWQQTAFPPPTDPAALLREAAQHFRQSMRVHIQGRMFTLGLYPILQGLTESAGRPELFLPIVGGIGGVQETTMSQDLWSVAHKQMSREEFLRLHGYHGLHEGNLTGRSWRQDPTALDPLITAYSNQPPEQRPQAQAQRCQQARDQAMRELCTALPVRTRLAARLAALLIGRQVRLLQHTKASFVMSLDVARHAANGIGQHLAATEILKHPDDACYLTMTELLAPGPHNAPELVAFRRTHRSEYRTMRLPVSFTGIPQPIPSAPPAHGDIGPITGIGACAGVAEGRVRLITDLNEANLFQQGEILLCPITDPSWTLLFTLAAAVVIDVGGLTSHGAIVARELGIPCVIGTTDGTRRLRTGDPVRVDGTSGTVHRLSSAPHTP